MDSIYTRISPRTLKQAIVLLTTAICTLSPAWAQTPPAPNQLPTGGQIVAGQAEISQSGANMNITQSTNRAAINWQSFDIGSSAHVNFNQPSSSSVALNRVLNGNPSQIFGHLTANGQVFITNAAGVYFAPGASVNVGALVATTHSITDNDFMNGVNRFTRNGAEGSVVNEGTLTADLGQYIALLAPEVRNEGVIIAQMGTVALASGEAYELQFDGQGGLSDITVSASSIAALVENKQAIEVPGGLVILSAQAAHHLQGGVVKNSGTIEASGMVDDGGVIRLTASDNIELGGALHADAATNSHGNGGTVSAIASLDNSDSTNTFSGQISARGGDLGGDGGFVETSASHMDIQGSASVDTQANIGNTGDWLIDPYNYTIDASAATAIVTALNTSNVEVATSADTGAYGSNGNNASAGNITVSSAINSGSLNTLTLTAANTITVSAAVTTGALVLTGPGGITLNNDLTTVTAMTLNGNVTLGGNIVLTSGISDTINSYTTYVVPAGVTSLTTTLVGGAGGKGGNDGSHVGGSAPNVGSLTASFAVTPGENIYVAPGAGGTAGTNSTSNAGGGPGGTNQFNLGNGGTGGKAGTNGSSGGGGGGGAATIITRDDTPDSSTAMLIAGGGGGGGGSGNNDVCPSVCGNQASTNYQSSSMAGQAGYHSGNQPGGPINDGGGSGAGGGGLLGGLSNNTVFSVDVNEWTGRGGNIGSSGAANSFSTTSISTSVIARSNGQNGYAIISYGGGAIAINGTVNGGNSLTVSSPNSTVSITGAIGGSSALTSLNISGSQGISLGGGGVTTSGVQTYNGPVTLNANSTTFTTTNNTITFAGNISKGSGVNSNMTVTTGSGAVFLNGSSGNSSTSIGSIGITTTGTTTIGGPVYAASLTKSGTGATTVSGGLIQTSGGQSYADIFDLGGNTTLTSTGSGDITLSKALSNSTQSNLTINAAGGNVSIVGNFARGTNAIPSPIGDVAITASGTVTIGTSGTPILADAKSLSITADSAAVYASSGSSFTCGTGASATGICLTTSALINVANASTFTGPLTGTTTFTKSGAGSLTMTGVNTYSGDTTVNAGKMEIGSSGKIGNGNYNGNIVVNGQIRFNTSANNTINGTVTGTGFINTVGSGTTDITTQSHHNYYNLATVYVVPTSSLGGVSSLYGNAPTFSYQLATTAGGGVLITDASPSGTAVLTGAPTNTSAVGNYTIAYNSGITVANERYATVAAGNDLSWAITARPLTVTVSKVYNGNTTFSSGFALSGTVNGDATPTLSGSATVSSANAASYNSFASSTLSQNNSNYTLTGATIAATITQKPLNITVSKTYNGNTLFSSGFSLAGMVGGDATPTVSGSSNVASVAAGSYTSFASSTLSLSDANYTLSGGTVSATINAKPLTITVSKVYDGSALYSSGFTPSGMVTGDTAPTVSGTATLASANAGNYTSFASNTLSLSNANYTLSGGTISATVTQRPLGITVSKSYDGTTLFNRNFILAGMVTGESAPIISGSANVANTTANTYTTFSNSALTLGNANYTLTGGTVSATITPQPPAISEVVPPTPNVTQPTTNLNTPAPSLPSDNNPYMPSSTPLPNNTNTAPATDNYAPPQNKNTTPSSDSNSSPGTQNSSNAGGNSSEGSATPQAKSESTNNTTTADNKPNTGTSKTDSNNITVSVVKEPSSDANGVISVTVPKGMAAKADGFTFALPEQISIAKGADVSNLVVSKGDGSPLPSWISFNPDNKTFVATNVPEGGLPLSIRISKNGVEATIVISERP